MAYVSLREVARQRLSLPSRYQFASEIKWLTLAASEIHLTSHHLAIAIRFDDGHPQLGVILDENYLVRPSLDASGQWLPSYKPIAMRVMPMRLAATLGKDPLADLEIPAGSAYLSSQEGIAILAEDGSPNQTILSLRQLFLALRDSQRNAAAWIDPLILADLLVPLRQSGGEAPRDEMEYYVVDRLRFGRLGKRALSAMARHNFLTIDIAVASMFSQRALRQEWIPKEDMDSPQFAASRPQPGADFRIGLGSLPLTLDEGELFSIEDLDALKLGRS